MKRLVGERPHGGIAIPPTIRTGAVPGQVSSPCRSFCSSGSRSIHSVINAARELDRPTVSRETVPQIRNPTADQRLVARDPRDQIPLDKASLIRVHSLPATRASIRFHSVAEHGGGGDRALQDELCSIVDPAPVTRHRCRAVESQPIRSVATGNGTPARTASRITIDRQQHLGIRGSSLLASTSRPQAGPRQATSVNRA